MHRVVPDLIVENYRNDHMSGEFPAIGMFLDLSGFSKMTDTLMQHGQHGAEILAGLMHSVFDPLVKSIFGYGGKIVSFAGDGIMALYPIEGDERQAAYRALAAAWGIQNQLLENPDRNTIYGKFSFSVRIGLTVGSVSWRILQSSDGKQATYYFRGSAVDASAAAEHQADAGEILLTDAINDLLGDRVRSRAEGSHYHFVDFLAERPELDWNVLPPVDVEISRLFMPEDVIVHDLRGEFRQIVNLFMRIPDLDEETLEEFINTAFELRKQYGGLLTRIDFGDKGCNMLMLWGAPVAYESDVNRALNFILDLRERVGFPITAGVTYYIAHAGYLGSEMCEDYTCYGWGVNLASRFMMAAPLGSIWVDERAARKVSQRFEFEYVGAQPFKGFGSEQQVHVLHARRSNTDTPYQGEMVGRENELKHLNEFVQPLWFGRYAGVIAITGDAGIGKGRLIQSFVSSSLLKEHQALYAVCQADEILRQSFSPFRGWLFRYFGISSDQSAEERRHAFEQRLDDLLASVSEPDLARELVRTHSVLGALVNVYWDDSFYSQLEAEARYNNTFLALIALIKAESLRQPFLLVMDDAHFLDRDSRTLVSNLKRFLAGSPDSYPVAIIMVYRKLFVNLPLDDDLPDSEIELSGISNAEISHLAEIILGGSASPDLIKLVASRSEGNPYFAEQIVRYLSDENLLEMSREGWQYRQRGDTDVLPGNIRALLVARLDQLAHEVKSVVQTASVLGQEFELRVLLHMLHADTDVEKYIMEAERSAIWSPLNEIRYIFHHGLLRDAAYIMQMRARRQELHRLALSTLESLYAAEFENRYAELAYHAEQGGLPVKAREYYLQAARSAAGLFRNNQAVEYYTKALTYIPANDLAAQFDLVAERVELLARLGVREWQLKDLDMLARWADQLGDRERLAKVMMYRSAYHLFVGNYQQAVEYASHSEGNVPALQDTELALYTQVVWATALLRLGHMTEAMQRAKIALERARSVGNRDEECRVLNVMGLIALEQKESSSTEKYLLRALQIARAINNRDVEAKALSNLAMAAGSLNGDHVAALDYYDQSYRMAQELGDRSTECRSLGNLGFAAGVQGDFSAAYAYHEKTLLLAREINNIYQEINTQINLSALHGLRLEAELALQNAQQAAALAARASDRSSEAWAMLYMGHAYSLQGKFDLSRTAYLKSIEIRHGLDQPSLSMEPIAGLVETYLAEHDLESAAHEAERILQFLESGASLDGTDEPLRVYHACHQFLEQTNDSRAKQVLVDAKNLLETQASKFSDDASRKRYIENFPWRRAIWEAG